LSAVLKRIPIVVAIALLPSSVFAAEGVLIVLRNTSGASQTTTRVQIEKSRMRTDSIGAGGENQSVVFDGGKQVVWIINNDRMTYSEITKADADRLGGQVSDAMAQMQEQLKNLPADQRARLEARLQSRGRGMAGTAAPVEYRKAGADKVGEWNCTKYEGYTNNQKTSEICTVAPSALGFSAADFDVTRQFADFFRKLMPQSAESLFTVGSAAAQGFEGIPVRRVSLAPPARTAELTQATRQNFPDSTYEVPAGFQKQAFGMR
jgi:hypothetical protein